MLNKFNKLYNQIMCESVNDIEKDYIKAKKEYEGAELFDSPKYNKRFELYDKLQEAKTLYNISLGKIYWGETFLSRYYVKYVQYVTGKNPLDYDYKVKQYIELKNAKDMSTKLYYIDRKVSEDYIELRGVKLKQQENGVWKAQSTKYNNNNLIYGFNKVVPDIDDDGKYCLTHYKRFHLLDKKPPLIKTSLPDEVFYPIDNIDQWIKDNNVDLKIEEPVVHLTDKEVCKPWGCNNTSPEFEYAYKRHNQMMKEHPEQHKMYENSGSPSSNYSTTECTCGFEYDTDYS